MKIALTAAIPLNRLTGDHRVAQTMSLPLGPLYIATALEKAFSDIEIRFFNQLEDIEGFEPDVVGVSAVTQNCNEATRIAKQIKSNLPAITVLGGPHISALPQTLPDCYDFGVVGEGEETVIELIRFLRKRQKSSQLSPEKIKGIVYRDSAGKIVVNPRRDEIRNIDTIDIPNRQHFADSLGVSHFMTSRGCPFSCYFCSEPVLWKKYRTHSIDYIVKEIRDIQRHFNPPHLLIGDDLFTVDQKRLQKIADRFEEEGISNEMAFSAWGRVNVVNKEILQLLKRINMVYMAFGLESASSNILESLKPGVSLDMQQKAIDLCYDVGIKVGCTFIIASPKESAEDLEKTYQFIKKNKEKISGIEINPVIPLPGTPLWDWAFQHKLVSYDMDWDRLKDYSLFTHFDPEKYIVLNPHFHEKKYQAVFKKMSDLYLEYMDRSDMMEVILSYWNPKGESAAYSVGV